MTARTLDEAIALKIRGNESFAAKNYEAACLLYDDALSLFPLASGRLPYDQKAEKVKIHSNKAECCIRLGMYFEAGMEASEALTLDRKHNKSRLRRAKATWKNVDRDDMGVNPFAVGSATDDLDCIIRSGGEGAEEAKKLKLEIETVVRREIE
jgi:tetratricopeptide (TPR) repeat protein